MFSSVFGISLEDIGKIKHALDRYYIDVDTLINSINIETQKPENIRYATLDEMIKDKKILGDLTVDELSYFRKNTHIADSSFLYIMEEYNHRLTARTNSSQ